MKDVGIEGILETLGILSLRIEDALLVLIPQFLNSSIHNRRFIHALGKTRGLYWLR